jgi:hypothetical protein
MRGIRKALCVVPSLIASFALGHTLAAAAEFSANLVISNAPGQPKPASGELYVKNGKVRIETTEFRNGRFLVDVDAASAIFILPAQRIFMDARQSSLLTQILIPVDPNDPCGAWTKIAKVAGVTAQGKPWRCQRQGAAAVGKRSTIEYLVTSPQGKTGFGWIDPQLSFPIKFLLEDSTNIRPVAKVALTAGSRPRRMLEWRA